VSVAPRSEIERLVEALLFLSPDPVTVGELVQATDRSEQEVQVALTSLGERYAPGLSGVCLRQLAGGFTLASDPVADEAARRLFGRERLSRLTAAQMETLAIVAYMQPVSRPEIARIRGVSADYAVAALQERDLIEEAGRSPFGAALYRTTTTFLKLFGLGSLDDLPDASQWDPSPEEAGELRERLLRAGEARAVGGPQPT
jgi:segregation and condensation protein B